MVKELKDCPELSSSDLGIVDVPARLAGFDRGDMVVLGIVIDTDLDVLHDGTPPLKLTSYHGVMNITFEGKPSTKDLLNLSKVSIRKLLEDEDLYNSLVNLATKLHETYAGVIK